MKKPTTIILIFMLAGCGSGDDAASAGASGGSVFTATVGTREIEQAVTCENAGDAAEFAFSKYAGKEPGDINVSGLRSGKQTFLLTIHETTAEGYLDISAEFEDLDLTPGGATASGMSDSLVKGKSGTKRNPRRESITFEVVCR
tara:strand:- start:89 stop:520 length:432 start_codon:yes stop_codon:yes gene_type:complete